MPRDAHLGEPGDTYCGRPGLTIPGRRPTGSDGPDVLGLCPECEAVYVVAAALGSLRDAGAAANAAFLRDLDRDLRGTP
jgi:hypothetical protein